MKRTRSATGSLEGWGVRIDDKKLTPHSGGG